MVKDQVVHRIGSVSGFQCSRNHYQLAGSFERDIAIVTGRGHACSVWYEDGLFKSGREPESDIHSRRSRRQQFDTEFIEKCDEVFLRSLIETNGDRFG